MKNILIATIATLSLASGSAFAADMSMPMKAPLPAPAPVYSWTGCYLAGGGGYSMYNVEGTRFNSAGAQTALDVTTGGRGWLGQVQGGCDYQFTLGNLGQWVIGAFGDGDWGSVKGTQFWPSTTGSSVGTLKETSVASAGGRIGILVSPTFLAYESGGWTEARFASVNGTVINTGAVGESESSQRYNGWFLGSGFEYGFNWLPIRGLFLKTEFRFSEYQSRNVPVFSAAGTAAGFNNLKPYTETVTTELVYRFNWH